LLLDGEETLGRRIEHDQAAIEFAYRMHPRDFRVHAFRYIGIDDLAETQQHTALDFADHIDAAVDAEQDQQRDADHGHNFTVHLAALPATATFGAHHRQWLGLYFHRIGGAAALGVGSLFKNFVERHVQHIVAALHIDQHLAVVAQHAFDGIDIEALTRDFRRLAVLGQQRTEPRRLTLGARYDLLAIGAGFFQLALGATAGLGNNAVGVGFGLVFQTLAIFLRARHVVEGVLHLRRRVGVLDVHFRHLDAGLVSVEILLQTQLHVHGDLFTTFGDDLIHHGAANGMAQRALHGVLESALRLLHFEQVIFRIGDAVLHRDR